jgi:shikimate-5-dehydrogenase
MAVEAEQSVAETPAAFHKASKPAVKQKNFFIFGQGISFSMSPLLHRTAFRYHGLPHSYEILQTETVDELSLIISSPTFGGASVTMPHKLKIGKFCNETTEAAKKIGAINTLIVFQDPVSNRRNIIGDNTDWSGLVECLKLKGAGITESAKTGLVIGAGGASRAALYALHQSGIKNIHLVNRTRARAEKIAKEYSPIFQINVLSNIADVIEAGVSPDVIIGTIPADVTSIEDFPLALFGHKSGICVDMAYKPRSTPLLKAAGKRNDWKLVTGVEVLLEQAFDQSSLWLGLPAPKAIMIEELGKHDAKKAGETKPSEKL